MHFVRGFEQGPVRSGRGPISKRYFAGKSPNQPKEGFHLSSLLQHGPLSRLSGTRLPKLVRPARMSRTNRNFVFAYTFLVILPLAGLAGILKTGRNLTAPVSIDGVWILQV